MVSKGLKEFRNLEIVYIQRLLGMIEMILEKKRDISSDQRIEKSMYRKRF
jgi:hypothetical protein